MSIINAFLIAVSMYSKIPVPKAEWSEKNMRYTICFFPAVGVIEAALYIMLFYVMNMLKFDIIFKAACLTVFPFMITGKIHMDGFLDTIDALSSWEDRQKKLEILKDPHCGAFAVMGGIIYVLMYFAGMTEALKYEDAIKVICMGFILSRILSGISVVRFKGAKEEGLLYTFSSMAQKKTVYAVLNAEFIAVCAVMILTCGCQGILTVVISLLVFTAYRHTAYKNFGGITGDLAGFFLQLCEIFILYACVVYNAVLKYIIA